MGFDLEAACMVLGDQRFNYQRRLEMAKKIKEFLGKCKIKIVYHYLHSDVFSFWFSVAAFTLSGIALALVLGG